MEQRRVPKAPQFIVKVMPNRHVAPDTPDDPQFISKLISINEIYPFAHIAKEIERNTTKPTLYYWPLAERYDKIIADELWYRYENYKLTLSVDCGLLKIGQLLLHVFMSHLRHKRTFIYTFLNNLTSRNKAVEAA